MNDSPVVFSRPFLSSGELENLSSVLHSGHIHGDGRFTATATARIQELVGVDRALLTTSGTHALELASILLRLGIGDEVIMPSFTFSSAANAIALTGASIVFVDIDVATGNIDPRKVEKHITPATRAISIVHYGGVAADMEALLAIAETHGLEIIEDNAHGLGGEWRGRKLGTFGSLAIQSFHDTKNIHCGEGGALLFNDLSYFPRAEMVREKGTDRSQFLRGQVDKYTWMDIGSSYLPSELNAAVLASQLDAFDEIQGQRQHVWKSYNQRLATWADLHGVAPMFVPEDRKHPAHVFYLKMPSHDDQTALIAHLRSRGVIAVFHYIPLDSSPAGQKFGRTPEPCVASADFSAGLVRLPLWAGMSDDDIDRVVDGVLSYRVTGKWS